MFNMEKGTQPEKQEAKKELLKPYEISGKLFDSFRGREDVKNWIKNNDLGLVAQEFMATVKNTLDTTKMMEGAEKAQEVARYIKDDLDFNNQVFNNDEHETAFKSEADKYLDETYLKPEEPETAVTEGGK